MGLISVIVPVYKVERYLERCINSILSQSFSDFDLILVDDGSPDRCPELCDIYSQKEPRIHVIHQKNGGLSVARNVGIKRALRSDSRWITFIDSDDWVQCDYLQRLYNAAISLDAEISVCGFSKTVGDEPEVAVANANLISAATLWRNHTMNATVAWGKLYKKELFQKVRYPKGRYYEDEYVTFKLLFSVSRIAYDSDPLYCYFQNPDGIMNSPWCPQKMHALEALNLQVQYFRKIGQPMFAEIRWRFLCFLIQKHHKILVEEKRPSKDWRWLRKQVRFAYKGNRKEYELSPEKAPDLFRIAYPRRLNSYRRYCAVFNRQKSLELEKIYAEKK